MFNNVGSFGLWFGFTDLLIVDWIVCVMLLA